VLKQWDGQPGTPVQTTISAQVQKAAGNALASQPADAAIVAIQPSTGHILAIANNTTSQHYDNALLARVAPGSTFKIITSAALLTQNLVTLSSTVPCPTTLTIQSVVLHNSEGEGGASPTYQQDFATSCNNAFSSFYSNSGVTQNLLHDTAKNYFGLNQQWDIGVGETAQYMNVPANLSGAGLAESLVGQAEVVSCPLAMCSVAATVANGSFKQPIVVPKQTQIGATALPSNVQSELKTLMSSVISSGTAASVGFPKNGHFFAKTGTAEIGSGSSLYNNSWFVVFDDQHDIALGALAINGGYGAATAAPECLTVFKKLGYA
jgi:cell division protein FtsI/penicillin-binding protein 2